MRALLLFALFAAPTAQSAVVSSSDSGFLVKSEMTLTAAPAEVYSKFIEFGRWWSGEHSFSGSAANFSLKAEPGGCLCESLPGGGFVQHSIVVFASPGKMIRLDGSLGPLMMSGGSTSMTVTFKPEGKDTHLTLTFKGMGYEPKEGLTKLAPAYDEVLNLQFQRFKRYVETGKAGE